MLTDPPRAALHDSQSKIILLYLILCAAPQFILHLKPAVLAPPVLRQLSFDWLPLINMFEQLVGGVSTPSRRHHLDPRVEKTDKLCI